MQKVSLCCLAYPSSVCLDLVCKLEHSSEAPHIIALSTAIGQHKDMVQVVCAAIHHAAMLNALKQLGKSEWQCSSKVNCQMGCIRHNKPEVKKMGCFDKHFLSAQSLWF